MKKIIVGFVTLLALSGCEGTLIRLAATGDFVVEAADNEIRRRLNQRAFIRDICWARLVMRVTALDAEGRHGEADQLLLDSMPGLITLNAARALFKEGKSEELLDEINAVYGCSSENVVP